MYTNDAYIAEAFWDNLHASQVEPNNEEPEFVVNKKRARKKAFIRLMASVKGISLKSFSNYQNKILYS